MGHGLMEAAQWVGLAAFFMNAVVTIVGVTWKLSRVELSLRDAITNERKDIDGHLERQAREFGETASALRQKVHEVEVYMRDTFVRRDGFYKVKDELSIEMKGIAQQLNARLDRLEAKMDSR